MQDITETVNVNAPLRGLRVVAKQNFMRLSLTIDRNSEHLSPYGSLEPCGHRRSMAATIARFE